MSNINCVLRVGFEFNSVPGNYNSNSNANAAGNNSDMQPLPGDPGVEVAPVNSTAGQPVVVEEEDVLVQETEDGE